MPRDFSKFKTEPDVNKEQDEFIKYRDSHGEPPELTKAQEQFVKSVLNRHGWLKSKTRNEVAVKARVARGSYQCQMCQKCVGPGEYQIDHLTPRHSKTNSNDLEDWIRRTFCPASYLACLCVPCHKFLTNRDNYS